MRDSTPHRIARRERRSGSTRIALVPLCLLLGFVAILFGVPSPQAAEKAPKAQSKTTDQSGGTGAKIVKSDSPFHISSDRMEAYQKDKVIIFDGHVAIRQDDLVITGARMKVTGAGAEKDKNSDDAMMSKIDRIEIEGEVRITQREKIATADKAIFYHQEQKVVLMGNPMVSQGQDMIRGRLITLFLNQGKSVVEGGEQNPVQAVLHPAKKE